MSSEKPFWKGKTLMEIQNLDKRVKVTMENGDVFIGKLVRRSRDTDGICSLSMQLDAHRTYLHVFSAESSDTQPIIPSYVDTVELLDDPEYKRIDDINAVCKGDVFVANDGNKYLIDSVDTNRAFERCKVYLSYAPDFWLSDIAFAYALRLKSRLPDKPGLWLDNEDCVWLYGEDNRLVRLDGSEGWQTCYGGMEFSNPMLRSYAPFRPAKAVEA